jgi:hypothetical protein
VKKGKLFNLLLQGSTSFFTNLREYGESNTEVLSMRKYRNRKVGGATPESGETEEAANGGESGV